MFVCAASYHKLLWYLLYVKCLWVWPVIINVFGICYMTNVCVCVWPVIINGFVICYMLNVCVCWPVIINGFGICYMLNICVCGQ